MIPHPYEVPPHGDPGAAKPKMKPPSFWQFSHGIRHLNYGGIRSIMSYYLLDIILALP
jgi:hypothetical protein